MGASEPHQRSEPSALAIRDLSQDWNRSIAEDNWRRAWMTAHDELDDARAALDRCVTDLIEQPAIIDGTTAGSMTLSGTVTTTEKFAP